MSANTQIEWTDRTWNPVRGCSVVSPGCVNCYAMKFAHRFNGPGKPYEGLTKQTKAGPQWTGQVRLVEDALLEPLKWRKPARVFVNSMSDLFHADVPDEFIVRAFAVMALAPRHTFQILTKRPSRMLEWMTSRGRAADVAIAVFRRFQVLAEADRNAREAVAVWPLPNVWLGVSVEDQQRADERIPLLLQTPAAVRFISAEPLLGPVNLHPWLTGHEQAGTPFDGAPHVGGCVAYTPPLDWVIVGGESGPGARRCDVAWVRSVVRQCREVSVPVFVKQLGSCPTFIAAPVSVTDAERRAWIKDGWTSVVTNHGEYFSKPPRLSDRKGGDPTEWSEDLRVREFPA